MAVIDWTDIEWAIFHCLKKSHGYTYLPEESYEAARKAIVSHYENVVVYIKKSKTGIKKLRVDRLTGKWFVKVYEIIIR